MATTLCPVPGVACCALWYALALLHPAYMAPVDLKYLSPELAPGYTIPRLKPHPLAVVAPVVLPWRGCPPAFKKGLVLPVFVMVSRFCCFSDLVIIHCIDLAL